MRFGCILSKNRSPRHLKKILCNTKNYLLTKQKANCDCVTQCQRIGKEFDSLLDGQTCPRASVVLCGVIVNLEIWQTCFVHEAGITQLIEETSRLLLAAENGSWCTKACYWVASVSQNDFSHNAGELLLSISRSVWAPLSYGGKSKPWLSASVWWPTDKCSSSSLLLTNYCSAEHDACVRRRPEKLWPIYSMQVI